MNTLITQNMVKLTKEMLQTHFRYPISSSGKVPHRQTDHHPKSDKMYAITAVVAITMTKNSGSL